LDYYNKTVKPALASCKGCHDFASDSTGYYSAKYQLASPSRLQGGTATDNALFDKPRGTVKHAGGTFCGSNTASPCGLISTWWGLEFN
jgi:hypothetical protein